MIARWTYQFFTRHLQTTFSRLWVRLSLAFSAVAFISVATILVVITLVSFTSGSDQHSIVDAITQPGGTVNQLREYYMANNSWDDVEVFFNGMQSTYPITPQSSISFAFVDQSGEILFNSHPTRRDPATIISHNDDLPIMVDGEQVGTLSVMQIDLPRSGDWQTAFLSWLRDRLWLIVLAGTAGGILAGVLMSRSLAAPMSDLATAAQQIGARKLSSRVEATGTTEVIALANAFNTMAHDLEQAETLRRNMVADVAHELRTPLTVLQGNLRAIIDGVYPLETHEITNLYDQTLILKRLVNDLHELSQAEARKLPLNLRQIDVTQLIETIVTTFTPVAETRDIHIQTVIPATLPFIRGDATRISQVLNNLMDNALRHTPAHGEVVICADAKNQADALTITIADTGTGITDEHLPYVFERFYRVDRARSRHTGGTGLGLAIAKAIIEAHDGQISAHSDGPGRGTTFRISLPSNDMIFAPEPLMLRKDHP